MNHQLDANVSFLERSFDKYMFCVDKTWLHGSWGPNKIQWCMNQRITCF